MRSFCTVHKANYNLFKRHFKRLGLSEQNNVIERIKKWKLDYKKTMK